MAGISTTGGVTLPTPQALFANTTTPAAPSTTPTAGPTVSGPGGTTTLPEASQADFASGNPTPLDKPHPQYLGLIQSHVAVLQAIGTPEAVIAQLNSTQPQAEYIDRYIQGQIMQNPEGWDAYVGNTPGTARAGLQQLMPGVQLPAPGAGNGGYLPDGSPVSGINIPGVSTPITTGPVLDPTTGMPQASRGEGLVKGLVFTAAAIGVGLLGWKFLKGRGAAKAAQEAAKVVSGGGAGGSGAAALKDTATSALGRFDMSKIFSPRGASEAGDLAIDLIKGRGGAAGLIGDVATNAAAGQQAASIFAHANKLGPVDGFMMQVTASAAAANISVGKTAELMLANRQMGVLERAVMNGGGLADLALANVSGLQLGGLASTAGLDASKLAGLRSALTGVLNSLS